MKRFLKIISVFLVVMFLSLSLNAEGHLRFRSQAFKNTGGTTVTWDANFKGPQLTLSDGNRKVTHDATADWESVGATQGRSTGKYYFEIVVTVNVSMTLSAGVAQSTADVEKYCGEEAVSWGYFSINRYYHNASWKAAAGSWGVDDVIGMAVDLSNGKIWFAVNNTWDGDPGAGTGEAYSGLSGTLYPMLTLYGANSVGWGRFKSTDLSYTPPSGFSAWE